MIEVRGITKSYGPVVAVRDVSFRVGKGAIIGLLGPNGAGKTTTLRMLAGVLGPTSGQITIAGNDILESPILARSCIGYLAETSPLYPEMQVGNYLTYRAALKGIKRQLRGQAVYEATTAAHCHDVIEVCITDLSRGYRQRVGLADALLAKPPVLLLDEPTAGLDPNQIREVRELISQLGRYRTVVLSTHVLAEVEAICTHAVVIHRGQLVAHDSLDALRANRHAADFALLVRDPGGLTPSVCAGLGWGLRPSSETTAAHAFSDDQQVQQFTVYSKVPNGSQGAKLEQLIAKLVQSGIGLRGVRQTGKTLESVFATLTDDGEAHLP